MRLPNGEHAELGTKLEDYVLNADHLDGRHKARVFESALGITIADAWRLREALLEAAANSEGATHKGHNGFGHIYSLPVRMPSKQGTVMVQSAWIVLDGECAPRLVSCYVMTS